MRRTFILSTLLASLSLTGYCADLDKARAEPNLEKRARLALEAAAGEFETATHSYSAGEWGATRAAFDEMVESVQLARVSLDQTGKKPRNSSQYKNLEIKTRALLRGIGDLVRRMAFAEREQVATRVKEIQKIHDDTLMAVMGQSPAGKK